jgi:hypothetical protein
VHDTAAGRVLVDELAWRQPTVAEVWVDAGYKQSVINHGAGTTSTCRWVTEDPQQRGLTHIAGAGRSSGPFGSLKLHRRLVRDCETNPRRSQAMIHWAMIGNMTQRPTGDSTVSWRGGDT